MERVLLRLLLGLLKLVFQLVVFVATGSWVKFERRAPQANSIPDPADATRSKRKRGRREQTGRAAQPPTFTPKSSLGPTADAPWPFEFAAELSDPEPYVEEGRADDASLASLAARRARAQAQLNVPALTSVRGEKRSLSSALRDRRTVREALVLGAALGPRGPRRPRH